MVARRQQEQRCGHAHRQRDRPAQQPLADRAGRRAGRQHERQQRGPLTGGDGLAEHAGEGDHHAEHEHQTRRTATGYGATRVPSVMRTAPLMPSPAYATRAGLAVTGKIRQDQQREGPEDREQRRLRIARDCEAQRGGRRDDDRRAHCAPKCVVFGIALANPVDRPPNNSGRRASHQWERKRTGRSRARRGAALRSTPAPLCSAAGWPVRNRPLGRRPTTRTSPPAVGSAGSPSPTRT